MEGSLDLARAAASAEPMHGLRAIVALRRELEALEARQVDQALHEGRSWSQIAEALGVSKQAAHKRHAQRAREATVPREGPARGRLLVTGQARRVVERAREEAQALGSESAGPEHLLLGLAGDDHGTALRALEAVGVRLDDARLALSGGDPPGPPQPGARVPVSPSARAALEQSLREAVRLGDSYLGVEHLLLALLRDRDAPAARLLAELDVRSDDVARRVHELVGATG